MPNGVAWVRGTLRYSLGLICHQRDRGRRTARPDAAELAAAVQLGGPPTSLGGIAELKAKHARLDETVTSIMGSGIAEKGFAPLLLDFPSEVDGERVLLCWLEGDDELRWYHREDLGFAGRRPLR